MKRLVQFHFEIEKRKSWLQHVEKKTFYKLNSNVY